MHIQNNQMENIMSIKTKTAALVLLGSLLASTSSFAQSSLNGMTTSADADGRTVQTGTDNYGNKVVRTFNKVKYDYAFEIDCYDRSVSNASSKDAIDVYFSSAGGAIQGQQVSVFQREKAAANCNAFSDARYLLKGRNSPLKVTKMDVIASGSDALWMDEIYLKEKTTVSWQDKITSSNGIITIKDNESRSKHRTMRQWGDDGGKGYCISTNPGSASAFGSAVDGCHSHISFNVATGGVSIPNSARGTTSTASTTNAAASASRSVAATPAIKSYRVDVKTSDIRGAGTDSNIYLTLNGTKGKVGGTTGVLLNPKLSGNAFERDDTDSLTLAGQPDIDRIYSITLRSDGRHPGADWNVQYVRINGQTFNCGNREIDGAGSMTCSL